MVIPGLTRNLYNLLCRYFRMDAASDTDALGSKSPSTRKKAVGRVVRPYWTTSGDWLPRVSQTLIQGSFF